MVAGKRGPDYVGRYEVLFSKLREALAERGDELTACTSITQFGPNKHGELLLQLR